MKTLKHFALVIFIILNMAFAYADDVEVWLGPLAHQNNHIDKYVEMINNPEKWEKTGDIVDVLLVDSNDNSLNSIISSDPNAFHKINDLGIDIAVESFIAKNADPNKEIACDSSINAKETVDFIKKIKSYGGNVRYVNMVEPLYEMQKRKRLADHITTFGIAGDMPIIGDWDNDNKDSISVYRNKTESKFFLANSNTEPNADDTAVFGNIGDIPISGDWDGDGDDTIGIYRPSTSRFQLSNSNENPGVNIDVTFGIANDIPIIGDWDGDGKDSIGVYRKSTSTFFLRNANSYGAADVAFSFGISGDIPISGDWDGDGKDSIGVYRKSTSTFWLADSFSLENTCKYTNEQVALEAKEYINTIKSYDSSIIIGQVEAMPIVSINEIDDYLDSLEDIGVDMPYLYLDFNMLKADEEGIDLGEFLQDLENVLKKHNTDFGMIIFPSRLPNTDKGYYEESINLVGIAQENVDDLKMVSFETWGSWSGKEWPSELLSENTDYSLTNIVANSYDILNDDECGDGICDFGETVENCRDDCNVNCGIDGTDENGYCRTSCGADEACDGRKPGSTLASCSNAGDTGILDRCSKECITEDKLDYICRDENAADDCTADAECNGKRILTYNCDESCFYKEPTCGDYSCGFGETVENCRDDCINIKEDSCGDYLCSDPSESCSNCPEDCGFCSLEDEGILDEEEIASDVKLEPGKTGYDGTMKKDEAIQKSVEGPSFIKKMKCFFRSIFLFEDYDACISLY